MIKPIVKSLEVALQSDNIHSHVETIKNDLSKLIIDNVDNQNDGLYATVYDFEEMLVDDILNMLFEGPTSDDLSNMTDLADLVSICQTLTRSANAKKESTLVDVSDHELFKYLKKEAVEFELILTPYV